MFTKKLLLVVGGLLIGLGQASADLTVPPNLYECTGKQVNLVLGLGTPPDPDSVGYGVSEPFLKLSLGKKDYSFVGDQIKTEHTMLGDFAEVQLAVKPEVLSRFASVLIPTLYLGILTEVEFRSQLVLTNIVAPASGTPLQGVVNPSSFIDLKCNGTVVY